MIKMLYNFLEFFLVLSVMFLLFSFLSYLVMKKISLARIFSLLDAKMKGLGNVISALIGGLTPFCVCTTIPVFTSMIQMGVKTNVALSFLFSSPLVSISAAVLIVFLFGLKFSLFYIFSALVFSVLGGLTAGWLKMDGQISDKLKARIFCAESGIAGKGAGRSSLSLFRDLFFPLLTGALIAGLLHNYVPVNVVEAINRYPLWMVIPLAALIGFPIYSNIMVLAPICFALADKGANQGVIMTFMMSGAGISFPTTIVLKSLFKKELFLFYLLYTYIAYCLIGYVFNLLK